MGIKNGMTPRQLAMSGMMEALRDMHGAVKMRHELQGEELSPHQADRVRMYIRQEHNRLLTESGLDGLELEP